MHILPKDEVLIRWFDQSSLKLNIVFSNVSIECSMFWTTLVVTFVSDPKQFLTKSFEITKLLNKYSVENVWSNHKPTTDNAAHQVATNHIPSCKTTAQSFENFHKTIKTSIAYRMKPECTIYTTQYKQFMKCLPHRYNYKN